MGSIILIMLKTQMKKVQIFINSEQCNQSFFTNLSTEMKKVQIIHLNGFNHFSFAYKKAANTIRNLDQDPLHLRRESHCDFMSILSSYLSFLFR